MVACCCMCILLLCGMAKLLSATGPLPSMGLQGLFNFKPSVRPVPLECHIQVDTALHT